MSDFNILKEYLDNFLADLQEKLDNAAAEVAKQTQTMTDYKAALCIVNDEDDGLSGNLTDAQASIVKIKDAVDKLELMDCPPKQPQQPQQPQQRARRS